MLDLRSLYPSESTAPTGKGETSTLRFAPISAMNVVGNMGATLSTFGTHEDVWSFPPPEDGTEHAGVAGLEGGLAAGSAWVQCGREAQPGYGVDEGGNGKAEEEAERAWYEDELPEFVRDPFKEGLEREMGVPLCEFAVRAASRL